METGQKTTPKINKSYPFSIINLTIKIGYNEIGFILFDNIENILIDFTDFTYEDSTDVDNIITKYFDDKKYNNLFNLITVEHYNSLHSIVPQALFDKNKIKNYLKFNNSLLENDQYLYDIVNINESINVFVPEKFNFSNIQQYSKKIIQKHYTTSLINEVYKIEKNNTNSNLYLNLNNCKIDVILVSDNQLKFINTFDYSTDEDIVYYVLFCFEQLNLNPENSPLIIAGDFNDSTYNMIFKYIRHVSIYESKLDLSHKFYLKFKNKLTYNSL
jgi:hypothetical protein